MISLIPIHDDNPTRRTAVVTLTLIAINVVVFLLEPASHALFGQSSSTAGRPRPVPGGGTRLRQDPVPVGAHRHVPARRLAAPARQHAVPVGVRQQRRGPPRPRPLPALLPGLWLRGDLRLRPHRPEQPRDPGRGVRRDRRGARRLPDPVPEGPGHQPDPLPVLPARPVPGVDRARLLVRPAVHLLPGRGSRRGIQRGLLRAHRRVRRWRGADHRPRRAEPCPPPTAVVAASLTPLGPPLTATGRAATPPGTQPDWPTARPARYSTGGGS